MADDVVPDRPPWDEDGMSWQERACYGRKPHDWGAPTKSEVYGCVVQGCSRCGAVRRAAVVETETGEMKTKPRVDG